MDTHGRGAVGGHIGTGGQFNETKKTFTLNPDAPVFTLSAEAKEFVPRSASNQFSNNFSSQCFQNHQVSASPVIPQPQMQFINHPLIRQVNELVVQLTFDPNKFDQVACELTLALSRQMTNVSLVKEVITVIFEQGVGAVHFRYSGARLCQYLAKNITQPYFGPTFESLLLQRCHEEFSVHDIYMVNESSRVSGFALFLTELFTQLVTSSSQPLDVIRDWLYQLQQTLLLHRTDTNLWTVSQIRRVVDNNGMEIKTPLEIPEEEVDPLTLFVGNLRQNVNKDELLATLTHHANVTSAFIIKKKLQPRNYGFVFLPTEEDMKRIMDLNNKNCYLSGSRLIFRHTCKRFIPPGVEGFVRQPLPDRDYDLIPIDPTKPSIHILVDDVMMKILKYLPLNERILCEIVCRRWQALLYVIFERSAHLNLSADYLIQNSLYINDSLYISKEMLSKMLLLTGESLKSLSLSDCDYILKENIFLIIAQLCPNLENLDLSNDQSWCFNNIKALKDCDNLKSFSVNRCTKFDEHAFMELISVLPCLEKIYVSFTAIKGDCFNILPKGLKELNISFCFQVSNENLHKISKTCKSLEVLEIENLNADKEFLEELGVNCKNLRSLKFNISNRHLINVKEVSNQVKVFNKLKSLKIVAYTFELPNIVDTVRDLEELHIKTMKETTNMVEFGNFTHLKYVFISSPFRKQELISLERCKNLQYVTIEDCDEADQEIIKKIVKGCSKIKHIKCPKVGIDIKFITDINEIMKNRSEPIKVSVNRSALTSRELFEALYDTKKIDFTFVEHFRFDEDSENDFDSDDDDDDDDDDFYDSDEGMDPMDYFWPNARVGFLFQDDEDEDEYVDESRLEKMDIELVVSMAKVSRARAVQALKRRKNDIVQAIMDLTM